MRSLPRFLIYLVVTIISLATFIYYMSITDKWEMYGYNLGFLVLIGSLIYTIYMAIHELIAPEDPQVVAASEGLNVNNLPLYKNFMIDVYFKYLFSFALAVLIFYVIYVFRANFEIWTPYPDNWYYTADIYVNLILPLFCVLDIFITPRYRHHHPVSDILVLFIICFVHCAYKILMRSLYYKDYNIILPTIADYMTIYLISLNGYILYDYLLYAKQNPVVNVNVASDYNLYRA
jgi:hypothetical protein